MSAQPFVTDSIARSSALPSFDGPIDASKYLVRPGERLLVTPIGVGLLPTVMVVDPEGAIVDPRIGVIEVAGKTLAEVRSLLSGPLSRQYRAERIVVSVEAPRLVSINVVGAVEHPGIYTAYTSQHVSEIIAQAGGLRPWASTRLLELSGGPAPIRVDLDAMHAGAANADAPVYAGTTVTVPPKSGDVVRVVGEVHRPMDIELVSGETVAKLIMMAGGALPSGDPSQMNLTAAVRPGDLIVVPTRADLLAKSGLVVTGAVQHPGAYGFTMGKTIDQLLADGGGAIANANLSRSAIYRRCDRMIPGADSLPRMVIGGLCDAGGKFANISLNPFDTLVIPRLVGWVKVSGQVALPGTVPFTAGKPVSYYILAVGDYLPSATRLSVIIRNRVTGEAISASSETVVSDGDEILVPSLEGRR